MIVVKDKKALVLKTKTPEKFTAIIPTAKHFRVKGADIIAVPHRIDETKVLRNLGVHAPSPIAYHYAWPGRHTPFDAQKHTAEFLTLNRRAFVLNSLGCVDSETEYLSPTGWVKISEYVGGEVAQYHPESKSVEFVQPDKYVKLPCHEMIKIKTKYGVDQLLSPEHRVLLEAKSNKSKTEVLPAAELFSRHEAWAQGNKIKKSASKIGYSEACIPVTFNAPDGAGIALTDAQLRVQIAVIADAHFPNRTAKCVIRLKKERKKIRLRKLLQDAGIEYTDVASKAKSAPGYNVFSFIAPWRTKHFDSRFWSATVQQLEVVCDEVMHWDGNVSDVKPTKRFSTFVKESADFVQYAYAGTKRTARVLENTRFRRGKEETEYVVHVRSSGDALMLAGSGKSGKLSVMDVVPSTDGFKYCFMVPSTFLLFRRNGCVFASGNTGKTLATLYAYDYLKKAGLVNKMLVVSPLSTLERTWADEVFTNFPDLQYSVLYGDAKRRKKLLALDSDIYIINHDGLGVIKDELAKRPDIDLIVIDEIAQCARNASTQRWKTLNTVVNAKGINRWAWGLTGTPTPNAPTDAWAQVRLLMPDAVSPYFNRFRDTVMRQQGPFTWVPKANASETVKALMQPAIRFTRDECIDLPECMYDTREVELTPEQAKAYKEMMTQLKTEVEAGEVLAVNAAVKLSKLVQIACGVVYGTNGEEVSMPATPRLQVLNEVVESADSKVIVYVPFVSSVEMVTNYLREQGHTVESIHGGTPATERNRIFYEFQKGSDLKVLVAQPATISHGLTLTAASTIVWYSAITSNDIYEQACARITRPGQKLNQYIIHLQGTEAERSIYKRLQSKQKIQNTLLDLVKSEQEI